MQIARVLLFLASLHACLSSSLFDIAYSGKAHHAIFIVLILDPIFAKLTDLKISIQANELVHYPTSINPWQGSVFYLPPSPICRRSKTGNSPWWPCMMSLLTLPNEALLMIANDLHRCKDIRSLCLTNRRFYYLLIKHRLAQSSVKECHETLLGCAAAAGNVNLAAELLDNLARTQMKSSNSDSQKNMSADYNNKKINSAFYYHPLFKKGYTQ